MTETDVPPQKALKYPVIEALCKNEHFLETFYVEGVGLIFKRRGH